MGKSSKKRRDDSRAREKPFVRQHRESLSRRTPEERELDRIKADAVRRMDELSATRECGGCTACCTIHRVKDRAFEGGEKPGFTDCVHQVAGVGCGIYEDRPRACRGYRCQWLMGLGILGDEDRPDRSGVVVTKEQPTQDTLELALNPFHEFECTGMDNEFVQDIDKLGERRQEWESGTRTMVSLSDNSLVAITDDSLYHPPTEEERVKIGPVGGIGCDNGLSFYSKDWGDGLGYSTRVRRIPEGASEVIVPFREIWSFVEYMRDYVSIPMVDGDDSPNLIDEHKYGYFRVRGGDVVEVIDRTNPNAKWDWWSIGGRYGGTMIPLDRAEAIQRGVYGIGGPNDDQKAGGFDICRRGNLDLESMRTVRIEGRQQQWDSLRDGLVAKGLAEDAIILHWRVFASKVDEISAAWKALDDGSRRWDYFATTTGEFRDAIDSGVPAAMTDMFSGLGIDENDPDITSWIQRVPAITAYAFITEDGEWVERGKMGWFGMSSNEQPGSLWDDRVSAFVTALPEDRWLTSVDCHI
jgi:hypothetical protein